jgi:hypothetical protein
MVANQAQVMNLNGLPLDIYAVRSTRTPTELDAAIDKLWRGEDAGLPIVHRQAGDWLVVSRRHAGWIHTVQWRAVATGGSRGFFSTINLERHPAGRVVPFLSMPASVRVRSYVQSREPDATYTQFVATSSQSAGSLLSSVVQIARRLRWAIGPQGSAGQGVVIALQRGAVELDLVVAPDPAGSSLVINQRETGLAR